MQESESIKINNQCIYANDAIGVMFLEINIKSKNRIITKVILSDKIYENKEIKEINI